MRPIMGSYRNSSPTGSGKSKDVDLKPIAGKRDFFLCHVKGCNVASKAQRFWRRPIMKIWKLKGILRIGKRSKYLQSSA